MVNKTSLDHPIFVESINLIRSALLRSDSRVYFDLDQFDSIEQDVLLRLIHSSGDLSLVSDVRFSEQACRIGFKALSDGAPILTDTAMAASAVAPMARRTFGNVVRSVLDWAPDQAPIGGTRSAAGMERALKQHPGAVVLVGSAPTALEVILQQAVADQTVTPSLVIGMPVGFVGVTESKKRLANSGLPQIRLEGSRGGAGLVAAAVNALLRNAWLNQN